MTFLANRPETVVNGGWNGFGSSIRDVQSPAEIVARAGLDYHVVKRDISCDDGNGGTFKIPGRQAIVNEGTGAVYGIASPQWEPVQHTDFLKAAEPILERPDVNLIAAGTMAEGARGWILLQLAQAESLFNAEEAVSPYLLFTNSHRPGEAVSLRSLVTVQSCLNQVEWTLNSRAAKQDRFLHVGNQQFDQELVRSVVASQADGIQTFVGHATLLGSREASADNVQAYYKAVFDIKDPSNELPLSQQEAQRERNQAKIDQLLLTAQTQPNATCRQGTWWQHFQACTYTVDHATAGGAEKAQTSAWVGRGSVRKRKALKLALEYAGA